MFLPCRYTRFHLQITLPIVCALAAFSPVGAQRPASVGMVAQRGISPTHIRATALRSAARYTLVAKGPAPLSRYLFLGAAAGAISGIVVSYIYTHQPRITDHSEDAIAYVVFVPTGAALGAVAGLIAGVSARR